MTESKNMPPPDRTGMYGEEKPNSAEGQESASRITADKIQKMNKKGESSSAATSMERMII